MSDRYTAVIKIVKVTETVSRAANNYGKGTDAVTEKHDLELASLVIRAGSLESLISKSLAHLALVDDSEA